MATIPHEGYGKPGRRPSIQEEPTERYHPLQTTNSAVLSPPREAERGANIERRANVDLGLKNNWWAIGDRAEDGDSVQKAVTDVVWYHRAIENKALQTPTERTTVVKQLESVFGNKLENSISEALDKIIKLDVALGYARLPRDGYYWRRWLEDRGPLIALTWIDDIFIDARGSGNKRPLIEEFRGFPDVSQRPIAARAVVIVGYQRVEGLVGTFGHSYIVRAGLGKDWGTNGGADMAREAIAFRFFEIFGLTKKAEKIALDLSVG